MGRIDKLLLRFHTTPERVKYRDVERILIHLNFEKVQAKGSHVKFKHRNLKSDLIIPIHNNECKDFYKKLAKKHIDNLGK